MPQSVVVNYATFLIQAAGALLSASVFYSFYRHNAKGYLLHWTKSWFALCIYLLFSGVGLFLLRILPADDPLRLTMSITSALAGYVQIAWLIFGTRELATGNPVPRRTQQWILASAVIVGVATTVLFVDDPTATLPRFFSRVVVRLLVAGLVFLYAGYTVWRAYAPSRAIGHRLVSMAFLLYGLEQFHLFVMGYVTVVRQEEFSYLQYMGFVDFLLQFAVGMGLVIWLLEEERKATVDASARIEHLAYHDALTGLPNRQLLLDRLNRAVVHARRKKYQLAVFFVDLDRFKVINDSLGHSFGDQLLQTISQRVVDTLRIDDTVSRIGGDELVILSPQISQAEDAAKIARKVRDTIKQPINIGGRELFVTSSIGIAVFPEDGDDAETLLKNADTAMYRAKAEGRDNFQLYTAAMNAKALEHLALENAMRRAVERGEFLVHYQPIFDTESTRVIAVETLLRWRHPELGVLSPEEFVFLAEATGLIVPIGEWALKMACAQVREWQLAGHTHLRAAVNLSVRHLLHGDFVARVRQTLADTGLPAGSLELEITESIAMHSDDATIDKFRDLRKLGVRITIDDFGTGYSSLSVLRLFPVDAVKIDRSFVSVTTGAAADTAIASAVIAMAHSLELTVTAEGVENEEQLRFLREQRCDTWQGFLGARPAPAAECGVFLNQRSERLAGSPVSA